MGTKKKKEKIVKAVSGGYHTVLLMENGRVYVEGDNSEGQLGLEVDELLDFTQVNYVSNIIDIAVGYDFTILLREDGKVLVAGCNNESQLGFKTWQKGYKESLTRIGKFTEIAELDNIVSITAGFNHSLFLRSDGVLFGAGNNKYGQIRVTLGGTWATLRDEPIKKLSNNIKACFSSYNTSAYLRNNDTLFVTGELISGTGMRLSGNEVYRNVKTVSMGETHFFITNKQGKVFTYGLSNDGQLGGSELKDIALLGIKSISLGDRHSVILTKDGEIFTSGEGEHGQLMRNDLSERLFFEKVDLPFRKKPMAIWAGDRKTFIVGSEGSLWISSSEDDNFLGTKSVVKSLGGGAYLTKIEIFE